MTKHIIIHIYTFLNFHSKNSNDTLIYLLYSSSFRHFLPSVNYLDGQRKSIEWKKRIGFVLAIDRIIRLFHVISLLKILIM